MGIYAVTGGSSGIGARTVEILKEKGNEVINIDVKGGDITADLATPEGRKEVVRKLHEMCPDGLDAMICNAGVSGGCGNIPLIISLNYFGAINIAQGVFDLLEKKGGSCVVTSSNSIAHGDARMDVVGLLNNQADEERILNLVRDADPKTGNKYYAATKYALARWARRMSADWGAHGVRLNAVAPGNVRTPLTAAMGDRATAALAGLPIPINYQTGDQLLDPVDIANVLVFLVSPAAHGVNGNIMFVDGGTDALLNSEKVY